MNLYWRYESYAEWYCGTFIVGLCVVPGLLLLCMVASEVWDAETKPIDFVCNRAARRAMNVVAELESALVRISICSLDINAQHFSVFRTAAEFRYLILQSVCCWHVSSVSPSWQSECSGLMTLSSPIQLPCPELHIASWESKSVCWHTYESTILNQRGFISYLL